MGSETGTTLTLTEARAIIARAMEKAAEFKLSGAFVVVDEGGNVLSLSRMEGAPPSSVDVAKAKAYVAAVTQMPTDPFARRMDAHPVRFSAYQEVLAGKPFPGPGGMPIKRGRRIVGGFATGPGIGPRRRIEGVDPAKLLVDGKAANAEDLITAYALEIPYLEQHEGVQIY
jgi:uncharacterized protein GlcG (DUF336 family)